MAKTKFPIKDSEFDAWFNRFQRTFSSKGSKFGVTPKQKSQFRKSWNDWHKWYQAWKKAHAAEQKAWKRASGHRKTAESFIGRYWARIQKSPHNTGQFAWFGIPAARKSSPKSARPKPARKQAPKHEFPWVKPVWNRGGNFTVWVGAGSNGSGRFPSWAKAAILQFRHKGGRWRTIVKGNSWPFIHAIRNGRRGSVDYRAAYVYRNGKHGEWSQTASRSYKKAA
ncbi:MAG: hypothetical protein IH851_04055 [Armatimonadetes bacterium]|nr:hypothetical protein [Armatimonadota bacterium]